jgi:DNA-binding MarR family transcriptional regulator
MIYSSADHAPPRTTPPRDGAARDQLVARITEMAPAMRRLFEVRPNADERAMWMSLTAHQLEALAVLGEANLTMRALCERLDISESAGTALSDRLVARGMVSRQADPDDRRIVRLSLSQEAAAMVERFRELKRRRLAEVLCELDDGDLAALARIYEILLQSSGAAGRSPRARGSGPTGSSAVGRDR